MPHHRHGHVGLDEPLESKKVVSGRNLPVRRAHIEQPARKILGLELAGIDRQRNRPDAPKTIAFPAKQLVISPRTARLITPDIDNMPSPNRPDTDFASWFR